LPILVSLVLKPGDLEMIAILLRCHLSMLTKNPREMALSLEAHLLGNIHNGMLGTIARSIRILSTYWCGVNPIVLRNNSEK
jgi:hypothetical protein